MKLERLSFGMGDRFGRQGKAQLRAVIEAGKHGVHVAPVWNKSNREHSIVGTRPDDVRAEADAAGRPDDVRAEADAAVRNLGWTGSYYVDADHIGLSNVDAFLNASNFFTIDVADFIGKPAPADALDAFVRAYQRYTGGALTIPGVQSKTILSAADLRAIGAKYLLAVNEAGRVFRRIESNKGRDNFVAEVSMDETDVPQSPVELFFILAALADEGVPLQTIAPKFSGHFNKGVDYAGNVEQFRREFDDDLAVIAYAVEQFGLPENLKLSVHSGSDKFAIYAPIKEAVRRRNAGLHVKTAGTTWLEEVVGLAAAGGDGLAMAKEIYCQAFEHRDDLTKPYAAVIDVQPEKLPALRDVVQWSGEQFAAALRHDPSCPAYNPHLRQLIHVGYKVAAQMGSRYLNALQQYEDIIAGHVTANLLHRHLLNIFP